MNTKQRFEMYLEWCEDLRMLGADYEDICEREEDFYESLSSNIARDIRTRMEHEIRLKCFEEILSKKRDLSRDELSILLDERTKSRIRAMALRDMEKVIRLDKKRLKTQEFRKDAHIATEAELAEEKAGESARKASEVREIRKNGLDVTIGETESIFRSKDGTAYCINRHMVPWHQRNHARLELIVRECAEAGLHVDWIAKILGIPKEDKRRIVYLARKLGFDVCQTPRSKFAMTETIRVLDEDGMFLVEKPNPFHIGNTPKWGG